MTLPEIAGHQGAGCLEEMQRRKMKAGGPSRPNRSDGVGDQRFPRALFLYEPHYCSPCLHQADTPPCGGDNVCMKNLPPASAAHALEHLVWGTGEKSRLRHVWAKENHTHRAVSAGIPLAVYRERDEG